MNLNLPGHRSAACLGKAALKTQAFQTLTRAPLTRLRARSVWSASDLSDLSALSVRRGRSPVDSPNAIVKANWAFNELLFGVPALAGPGRLKAGLRTDGMTQTRFMVPMHGRKAVEAFHEPQESEVHSRAESGGEPPHSKTLARWLGARTSARFWSAPAAAAL